MAKKELEIKATALIFFKNFEDAFVKSDNYPVFNGEVYVCINSLGICF